MSTFEHLFYTFKGHFYIFCEFSFMYFSHFPTGFWPSSLILKEFLIILGMFALNVLHTPQILSPSLSVVFWLYHVLDHTNFMQSNLPIFYFIASGFWVIVRKPLPILFRLKRNLPMFSSSTGMVLLSTFRSPVHLEIALMSGVRYESNFAFSQMTTPLSQHHSLKSLCLTQ